MCVFFLMLKKLKCQSGGEYRSLFPSKVLTQPARSLLGLDPLHAHVFN